MNGAVVVHRRVDDLHGLAFEAIGDLLERPALLVLDRTLDKLLGQLVDLLALLLVVRIDSVQFEPQRVGEYLLARFATRRNTGSGSRWKIRWWMINRSRCGAAQRNTRNALP